MKKFKVNYIFIKKNTVEASRFFDSEKEAKAAAETFNANRNQSKAVLAGSVEVIAHHTAIARGYVGVNGGYQEIYNGKFGAGYIEHYPTLKTKGSFRGNSWHLIEYFIEK